MQRWTRTFADYPSQVRLFTFLLLVFLLALLFGVTYLFSQARSRLEREGEESLRTLARTAAALVEGDPLWQSSRSVGPSTFPLLRLVQLEGRVERVQIWDEARQVRYSLPVSAVRFPEDLLQPAWRGEATLTPLYPVGEGFAQAYLLPLRGAAGGISGVLVMEARADFLGFLHRVRWFVIGGYAGGLLLAFFLSLLFVRSILKPYTRLQSAAHDFYAHKKSGQIPEAGQDMEFVAETFQQAIATLKEKEAELKRLYTAEQKRSQSLEEYQEYILGSISSGVISLKTDCTITVFNKTAQQIFGYGEEEVVGRRCHEVFGADTSLTLLAEEALRDQRVHSRLELDVTRRDGAVLWVGLGSSLLRGVDGGVVGLTFLLTDLTEIRRLQSQVMLKESLATLGQMSAGIAHEFRNSLGAILGFAKLLQKKIPETDPRAAHIQNIIAEINSLEDTIKDFLAFSKPAHLHMSDVDLYALIEECVGLYSEALRERGVKVTMRLPGPHPILQADPLALKQACGNLVRNALEAMPGGGELTISCRTESGGGEGEKRRRVVAVAFQDTGPGIPLEDRERIFTPFFTTKEKGTGLGLSLVQKAVLNHGGRVEVETTEGQGSTFTIYLPYGERRRAPRL